jgi:hypothetical protein
LGWLYIRKESVICDLLLVIILEARMAPAVFVENLIKENRELACILRASIMTAQAKASRIATV